MSALVQSQLVASLVKESREADTDWHEAAARFVDMAKSPHVPNSMLIELMVSKLRFAEAIGFGRGLDRATKLLGG